MGITAFDRTNIRTLHGEMMQALALVGNKYGVLIVQDGNGRFDPTEYRLRLKCKPLMQGAVKAPPVAKFPPGVPLTNDDIGKTCKFGNGEFRIDGFDPSQRSKRVKLTRLSDNKSGFKATFADVLNALGRDVPGLTDAPRGRGRVTGSYPGDWEFKPTDNFDEYDKRTSAMLAAIPQDKIIHFPRGDGHAMYFVQSLRPLKLQHIPYGDAWTADPMTLRGLTVADVERMTENRRVMRSLFASVKEPGAPPAPPPAKRKRG